MCRGAAAAGAEVMQRSRGAEEQSEEQRSRVRSRGAEEQSEEQRSRGAAGTVCRNSPTRESNYSVMK